MMLYLFIECSTFFQCKKISLDAETCLRMLGIISYAVAILDVQIQGNARLLCLLLLGLTMVLIIV